MNTLTMEIRTVDEPQRLVTGVVAPYDEVSFLTPDPAGERITRGAFAKSIRQRASKIPLFVGHAHTGPAVGLSTEWRDTDEGLIGSFRIKDGAVGDETLADVRGGYLPAMSVGFRPLARARAEDGATLIREGMLLEVSLVGVPAYSGAEVLSVRSAESLAELMRPFANPPAVNLAPFTPPWT